MSILITGGAGFIGSHTCVELLECGERIVVLDNLSNSHPDAIRRVEAVTRRSVPFVLGDVRDPGTLRSVISEHEVEEVVHFAGLKAVEESNRAPLDYYENNVAGTICLLQAMREEQVRRFVFSSSATVYGDPVRLPLTEDHPLAAVNPYGRTKLVIEEMLRDVARSEPGWRIATLRYFNPVGAHESGMIGEDPSGIPNNLLPYIARVAVGRLPVLRVFGGDYPTRDGTGVRDYIHVVDLAKGHVAALRRLRSADGCFTVNLGTGVGRSVLEMVRAVESASGRSIPYEIVERRPGDIATCFADASLAHELLGWHATRDHRDMCRDLWRWQSRNPDGYGRRG